VPTGQTDDVVHRVLGIVVCVVLVAQNWISCIIVRENVLFRREFPWKWHEPLDLSRLIRVERRRTNGWVGRYRVLELQDAQHVETISLLRWTSWRRLAAVVAANLDGV